MSSHDTEPMMSGLLLNFLRHQYNICLNDKHGGTEDSEFENVHLKIQNDRHGKLICRNQQELQLVGLVYPYMSRCDRIKSCWKYRHSMYGDIGSM